MSFDIDEQLDDLHALLSGSPDGSAIEPAEMLLTQLERSGTPEQLLRCARMAGWARRQVDDHPAALAHFSRALAVGARLPANHRRAFELFDVHLTWVATARKVPSIPATSLGPVLDRAEALMPDNRARWRLLLLEARAALSMDLGRADEALDLSARALQIAEHEGASTDDLYWAMDRLAGDLRHHGHLDEATQLLERARPLATRLGGTPLRSLLNNLGRLALDRKDGVQAWRHARHMLELARSEGSPTLGTALGLMVDAGRAAAQAGEPKGAADALAAAEEYLAIARARGIADMRLLYALMDIIDVRVDQGVLDEAQAALDEAIPIAAKLDRATQTTTQRDHLDERRQRLLAALRARE